MPHVRIKHLAWHSFTLTFLLSNGPRCAHDVSQRETFIFRDKQARDQNAITLKPERRMCGSCTKTSGFFKCAVKVGLQSFNKNTFGPVQRRKEASCMSFSVLGEIEWCLCLERETVIQACDICFQLCSQVFQCFILKTQHQSGLCGEEQPNHSDLHD